MLRPVHVRHGDNHHFELPIHCASSLRDQPYLLLRITSPDH
jgi:hypothetical protein